MILLKKSCARTPRILRGYRRIARESHLCDTCFHAIEPGDNYEGTVIAYGNGKLLVLKSHVGCPFDPEDEARLLREFEARDASESLIANAA